MYLLNCSSKQPGVHDDSYYRDIVKVIVIVTV